MNSFKKLINEIKSIYNATSTGRFELYSVTETNSPTHKFFRIKAERLP